MISEVRVSDGGGLLVVRELFAEYGASLGPGHLCVQDFGRELAGLPGAYVPPGGGLWLAREDGAPAGCVALRPLDDRSAELKRLYVRPAFRGRRLGRQLMQVAIDRARDTGCRAVRLDTFPSMAEAVALYRSAGFREIEAYHDKALAGSIFFELLL